MFLSTPLVQITLLEEIKMANISISDLQPAGSGLFANAETFVDSIRDLSENELKMTFGGGGYGCEKGSGGSKKKSGFKYKSGKGGCGCGYGC